MGQIIEETACVILVVLPTALDLVMFSSSQHLAAVVTLDVEQHLILKSKPDFEADPLLH